MQSFIIWIRLFFARRAAYAALQGVEALEGPRYEALRADRPLRAGRPGGDLIQFPAAASRREDLISFPSV